MELDNYELMLIRFGIPRLLHRWTHPIVPNRDPNVRAIRVVVYADGRTETTTLPVVAWKIDYEDDGDDAVALPVIPYDWRPYGDSPDKSWTTRVFDQREGQPESLIAELAAEMLEERARRKMKVPGDSHG